MKVNLGKKDTKIISWELLCTLNSIRNFPLQSGKPDVTLKNFKNYEMSEFNLKEAELTESEFKTIMRLLEVCKKVED